jgi:membrane protein DedA with SNARE-associated domain
MGGAHPVAWVVVADTEKVPIDAKGVAIFAIPLAAATIAGWIGDAFAPSLLSDAPLVLIALSPRTRNFVIVAANVSLLPFLAVAVARLLLTDPLFFWFGRRYGDVTLRWAERRFGVAAKWLTWLEKGFKRASWPMVALVPNNWICMLAGATAMNIWVFATLNIGGTVARMWLIWAIGDRFKDPLLEVTGWISDNRWWLTGITIAIVAVSILHSMRTSPRGAIDTPAEILDELEELEEELE